MAEEVKELLKNKDQSDTEETSTGSQVAVSERKKRVLSGNVPLGTLLLEKIGVCNCYPRIGCVRVWGCVCVGVCGRGRSMGMEGWCVCGGSLVPRLFFARGGEK